MKRVICVTVCLSLLAAFAEPGILKLPASTRMIGEEAFCGDTSLYEVILPSSVTEIGARAFADSSIRRVTLPDSIVYIAEDAFEGCSLDEAAVESEYCRTWCNAHGIYIAGDVITGGDTD